MILPSLLALGAQLLTPVADGVPRLNVEQVCQGIAVQGGSSFHDPAIPKEKRDCVQSENEVRQELIKRWSTFSAADKNHCINEATMGGDFELHRTAHLPRNGAGRAHPRQGRGHQADAEGEAKAVVLATNRSPPLPRE